MNFATPGLFNPVRKVYYNLPSPDLSVSICFFIGTVEVLGLLPRELGGLHAASGLHGQLRHQQAALSSACSSSAGGRAGRSGDLLGLRRSGSARLKQGHVAAEGVDA